MRTEKLKDGPLPESQPARILPTQAHVQSSTANRSRWWVWLLVLCGLTLGALGAHKAFRAIGSGTTTPAGAPQARAVPVVVAVSRRGDMPIYRNGLGTVTAFNTVTVHSRVDGQLMRVLFTEGQMVHEGDELAEIDKRPFEAQLMQAQGQLAKDQASLQNANLDLARYKQAGSAASKQEVDTAAASVAQYEGAIKADEGQIAGIKLQLTYCDITAPLSGRIGLRSVDAGNIVHANDPGGLLVITQLQPIAVKFSLPEDDLPQVLRQINAGRELTVEAYSRDLKTRLATGKLLAIDNQVDSGTDTIRFKARFENQDSSLFPNQFVNVRLLVDSKQNAVIIPAVAVQSSPQTNFVYVVKADETVEMRPVTLGPSEGDETVIDEGLEAGETVVTDGVDKLIPGMKVRVREPGPSQRGKPAQQVPGSAPASRPAADVIGPKHEDATAQGRQHDRPSRHGMEKK